MNTLPYRKPTPLKCARIAALVVAAAAPGRGGAAYNCRIPQNSNHSAAP